MTAAVPTVRRIALGPAVLAAAAVAWALLVWVDLAGVAGLSHHALGGHHGHGPTVGALVGVLTGWLIMVVAMMLPAALPLVDVLARLLARRPHPRALLAAGAAVFVAVWLVAGVALIGGDLLLHLVAEGNAWLGGNPQVIPGLTLLGAGCYQFSGLKRRCLNACRSPRSFALRHWQGRRPPVVEVSRLAAAYGASCVGCCWALMAVGFAAGVAALPVMVLLAVAMTAERLTAWGARLVVPLGALLLAAGAAVLTGLLPAATFTG